MRQSLKYTFNLKTVGETRRLVEKEGCKFSVFIFTTVDFNHINNPNILYVV